MNLTEGFSKTFFPHDAKKYHFRALDGLRGFAILLVMLSHANFHSAHIYGKVHFKGVGLFGVYLFFVLSAYLLDQQIAKALYGGRQSPRFWANYFLRRFLRIYPLFVIAVVIYALLTEYSVSNQHVWFGDVVPHLLLQLGKNVFWSIPVEFKYYFLSPILMLIYHYVFKWNLKAVVGFNLLLVIASFVVTHFGNLTWLSTFRFFPVFLVGTTLAVFEVILTEDTLSQVISARPQKVLNAAAVVLCLLVLVTGNKVYMGSFLGEEANTWFRTHLSYFPYAASWGIVLVAAKYGNGYVSRLLSNNFLRLLGVLSYSLYLFHGPILLSLEEYLSLGMPIGEPQLRFALFFAAVISFCMVTYLLIERPLSKIRLRPTGH